MTIPYRPSVALRRRSRRPTRGEPQGGADGEGGLLGDGEPEAGGTGVAAAGRLGQALALTAGVNRPDPGVASAPDRRRDT